MSCGWLLAAAQHAAQQARAPAAWPSLPAAEACGSPPAVPHPALPRFRPLRPWPSMPAPACSEKEIFTSILRGNLDFSTAPWPAISDLAKGARGAWQPAGSTMPLFHAAYSSIL